MKKVLHVILKNAIHTLNIRTTLNLSTKACFTSCIFLQVLQFTTDCVGICIEVLVLEWHNEFLILPHRKL